MMQNQKYRLWKPLLFIFSGAIAFISALVGYILTALDSYYDDGFGLSISYGSKDLLMITIISFLVMIFGFYLLVNYLQKKKEIDYLPALFIGVLSAIILIFFVAYIFKPIIESEVEINISYIMMIVSAILAFASVTFAAIIGYNVLKKKASYNSLIFSYVIFICYCLSLSLFTISKGISLNGNGVSICYFITTIGHVLELLPCLLGLTDTRLR